MPGGARRQLVPFQQHDVCPALLRQVVEGGASGDAAADDDGASGGLHVRASWCCGSSGANSRVGARRLSRLKRLEKGVFESLQMCVVACQKRQRGP